MKDFPRGFYIFIALIILVFLNILYSEGAFCQVKTGAKNAPAVSAGMKNKEAGENMAATIETVINKGAAHKTSQVESNKEAEKKKKNLKRNIYIFDTIVSGLMHLLIGTGLFMIVLMILKWFFLERRVDK